MKKNRVGKPNPLELLSSEQWESLCDGCGRCCLQKLKNPTTGRIYYTSVACYLLDIEACRCTQYELRHILVPDCIVLKPNEILNLRWLPRTCAYRLIAEGKELPEWHPLVSGDQQSVHAAGISVRGRAVSELLVPPEDLDKYILPRRL